MPRMRPDPTADLPTLTERERLEEDARGGALLTAAQGRELADALELSECSGATGDDVQRMSDAVHAVIPFTTLNIQTTARWLLAAHARVGGAE